MNRHTTERRMARRMQKRRKRILAEDAWARYVRAMPYVAGVVHAHTAVQNIGATTASTDEERAEKKLRMAQATIEGVRIGMEALRSRTTPTEILNRL